MNFPPPHILLPGHLLLITDHIASPADFLLHQFLAERIKQNTPSAKNENVATSGINEVVILTANGEAEGGKWRTLAGKNAINTTVFSNSVKFINILGSPSSSPSSPVLKSAFNALSSHLSPSGTSPPRSTLVILDEISVLQWIGFANARDVKRFVRALAVLCRQTSASLVIRHHILTTTSGSPTFIDANPFSPDDNDDEDQVFGLLLQLCTYHVEVRSLSSGRSGAVNGEIAVHIGPATSISSTHLGVKPIPRSSAVQYRLLDHSAVYFERGTGSGVL